MRDDKYHVIEYRDRPQDFWQLWANTPRGRKCGDEARHMAESLLLSMLNDEGLQNPATRVDGGRAITRRQLEAVNA